MQDDTKDSLDEAPFGSTSHAWEMTENGGNGLSFEDAHFRPERPSGAGGLVIPTHEPLPNLELTGILPQMQELAARTPTEDQIYALVDTLEEVKGSRKEPYMAEELKQLIKSTLQGDADAREKITRTYGLRKIVLGKLQLDRYKNGLSVDPLSIAEPLDEDELTGLVKSLRKNVQGNKSEHTPQQIKESVSAAIKNPKKVAHVTQGCGLRRLTQGVINEKFRRGEYPPYP